MKNYLEKINRNEVLKYLGYSGGVVDENAGDQHLLPVFRHGSGDGDKQTDHRRGDDDDPLVVQPDVLQLLFEGKRLKSVPFLTNSVHKHLDDLRLPGKMEFVIICP